MVGDPGIEPGMGLPGGVTVRCRTLQHVALNRAVGINTDPPRQQEKTAILGNQSMISVWVISLRK